MQLTAQLQRLIEQCKADTPAKRKKLYGLAMLRSIDNPRMVAHALGIGKSLNGYTQAFRPFYQDYAYIFTEETHKQFRTDIRNDLRRYLLTQRHEKEERNVISNIYENQQKQLHEREHLQDLRSCMRDEKWVTAFLDMLEAQFWLDTTVGVTSAISFLLAATLYHPHLIYEVLDIGSFFESEMPSIQHNWWMSICRGFNLLDSAFQPREKIKVVHDIKEKIKQEKLPIPAPFTPYTQQLIAALWWQEGELYREIDDLHEAVHHYTQTLLSLYSAEKVPIATAKLYWVLAEKVAESNISFQIEFLMKVIELQPDFQDAYYTLGNIFFDKQDYLSARTYYQYAIEIHPHDFEAWVNLGVLHTMCKEYQRALEELNYAERLDSQSALLYFNRANAHRELKDYAKALSDFNQAIDLNVGYVDAYINRGNIYAMLNQREQAHQDYAQATILQPNNIQALWLQEWVQFGKRRISSIVAERLQEIAKCDPNHYLAPVCTGIAMGLTQKDLKVALSELEHGCEQEPDQWDGYFWLSMLAAYRHRLEQARFSLQKAVELGLPTALLLPLYWLEKDNPPYFQSYALPILQKFNL